MFELHPRLSQDCIQLGRFPLCRLLLMNESRYPWFILVPERKDISEIYRLADEDQVRLMHESSCLSRTLAKLFGADKMNIAAIGNLVPQLHVHHVVRYRGDPAWPGPIWGRFDPLPYGEFALNEIKQKLKAAPLPDFFYFD